MAPQLLFLRLELGGFLGTGWQSLVSLLSAFKKDAAVAFFTVFEGRRRRWPLHVYQLLFRSV